jgi:N6-adenosine-specific RNA methylase IME4
VHGAIMLEFPNKKYQIIYADPSWQYHIGDKQQGMASNHYDTLSLDEICNLPVKKITDKNCYLFLWVTSPTLKEGLQVMECWGFTYKIVAFVWEKTNFNGMGLGHYTRTSHEFVLLGKKGILERKSAKVKQGYSSFSKNHSQKPNEIRKRIIQLYGDLPRIELFARTKIHGWDVWGNDEKLQNQPLEVFQ